MNDSRNSFEKYFSLRNVSIISTIIFFISTYTIIDSKMQNDAQVETKNILSTVLKTTEQTLLSWNDMILSSTKIWANSEQVVKAATFLTKTPRKGLLTSPWQTIIRKNLISILGNHNFAGYFIVNRNFINLSSSRNQNINDINLLSKQKGFFKKIWKGESLISELIQSDILLKGKVQASLFACSPINTKELSIIAAFCFRIDPENNFLRFLKGEESEPQVKPTRLIEKVSLLQIVALEIN